MIAVESRARQPDSGDRLLDSLRRRGLRPVGERSCKMRESTLLTERFLLGIPVTELPVTAFLQLLQEFGMARSGLDLFRQHLPGASEVQFAVERAPDQTLCKVYLEYWQRVVEAVRHGDNRPALLNLGFKWPAGESQALVLDRYICYPQLTHRKILGRLQRWQDDLVESVTGLVSDASARAPERSLVYLEVEDPAGQRHSWDINLYPCHWRLADATPRLLAIGECLHCDRRALSLLLEREAKAPLGHISGGSDRHGRPFFTFYYEVGELIM